MIVTWQVLNALTYPKRNKDFSRALFIVAPGLTVKERLQVLMPGRPDNFYDFFNLCPSNADRQKLNPDAHLVHHQALRIDRKTQISHVMVDSTWEHYTANALEKSDLVQAYAKNDHLGFQVYYLWNGGKRRFVPDFIVRLGNGRMLILEIKGEDSDQNRAKRAALDVWVKGVNAKGGFGVWCWDVAFEPARVHDILSAHAKA